MPRGNHSEYTDKLLTMTPARGVMWIHRNLNCETFAQAIQIYDAIRETCYNGWHLEDERFRAVSALD